MDSPRIQGHSRCTSAVGHLGLVDAPCLKLSKLPCRWDSFHLPPLRHLGCPKFRGIFCVVRRSPHGLPSFHPQQKIATGWVGQRRACGPSICGWSGMPQTFHEVSRAVHLARPIDIRPIVRSYACVRMWLRDVLPSESSRNCFGCYKAVLTRMTL